MASPQKPVTQASQLTPHRQVETNLNQEILSSLKVLDHNRRRLTNKYRNLEHCCSQNEPRLLKAIKTGRQTMELDYKHFQDSLKEMSHLLDHGQPVEAAERLNRLLDAEPHMFVDLAHKMRHWLKKWH